MKFKSLQNIIKKEIELAKTTIDLDRITALKSILKLINSSRTKEKLITNIKNRKIEFKDTSLYLRALVLEEIKVLKEIIDMRVNELNERLTHEYMMFDNFSDTKEVIKRLETEIEFYVDLKERLCK